MKKNFLFTNFLFSKEKAKLMMPTELSDIYEELAVDVKRKECTSFYPMSKFLKEKKEGSWKVSYTKDYSLLVAERAGEDFDTVLTYDGTNIKVAKVDKAGKFQHYADLKNESRLHGKSIGSPLMAAFYFYACSLCDHAGYPSKLLKQEQKGLKEAFEFATEECVFDESVFYPVMGDIAYRLINISYAFDNMDSTHYPFLKKKEYLGEIRKHGIDISDMPITQGLLKKSRRSGGVPVTPMEESEALPLGLRYEKEEVVEAKAHAKAPVAEEIEAKQEEEAKEPEAFRLFKNLQKKFGLNLELSKEDEAKVPEIDEKWTVTDALINSLKSIRFVGNNLLLYGPAGTGKSTMAKQIACVLGLPYSFFTCSEKTDESNLLVSIIPNGKESDEQNKFKAALSQLELIKLDAPSWMQIITGVYNPEVTEEACYSYINNFDTSSSKFEFVESELVKGIRKPSVVEIQEPTVISKPGVLVALNSLLDDNEAIKIASGEMVKRHPHSVIVLTTNVSYNGCRSMNQSVLSRMDGVIALSDISRDELVKRAVLQCSLKKPADIKVVEKMADYFLKIREYLKENSICDDAGGDGIIDPRGFVSWVKAYLNSDLSLRESVKLTIIDRTSLMDTDDREQTWESCICPLIPA